MAHDMEKRGGSAFDRSSDRDGHSVSGSSPPDVYWVTPRFSFHHEYDQSIHDKIKQLLALGVSMDRIAFDLAGDLHQQYHEQIDELLNDQLESWSCWS